MLSAQASELFELAHKIHAIWHLVCEARNSTSVRSGDAWPLQLMHHMGMMAMMALMALALMALAALGWRLDCQALQAPPASDHLLQSYLDTIA